ncbi:MAG: hypothetical protein HC765_04505 [Brachymonas sp.]|nr:hypothetical protein [Brachymonas sp.]
MLRNTAREAEAILRAKALALSEKRRNAAAALEVMSRFAANPKWLIYLPPTMSPSETSRQPQLLEHPAEAFAYYRNQGVARVVCEEKHMGSRAVVVVCKDAETTRRRFGIDALDHRCHLAAVLAAQDGGAARKP